MIADDIARTVERESDEEFFIVIGEGDWRMICSEYGRAGGDINVLAVPMWRFLVERGADDAGA
jgi:hypothetical protein